MNPQRPPALLVMAILNFVFGGLSLIWMCCTGVGILAFIGMASNVQPPPGQPNPLAELRGVYDRIPGFYAFTVTSLLLGVVMSIVLIVAGIGLLKVKRWGRTLCLIYAGYSILGGIFGVYYQLAYVSPAMQAWAADVQRRAGGAPGMQQDPTLNNIGAILGAVLGMGYAIALIIVMFLPSVRAAFAGRDKEPVEDFADAGPPAEDYDEPGDRTDPDDHFTARD